MDAAPGAGGLVGHVSANYLGGRQRDTENVAVFLKEFREYEKPLRQPGREQAAAELHRDEHAGRPHPAAPAPGAFTPQAMVANNDYAIGQLVER